MIGIASVLPVKLRGGRSVFAVVNRVLLRKNARMKMEIRRRIGRGFCMKEAESNKQGVVLKSTTTIAICK